MRGVTVYYGENEAEARAARTWRGGRYEQIEGQIIPWLWPLQAVYRAARRKGRTSAAGSMRACAEGGWWSAAQLQLHKLVTHDKCRCGKAADTLWHRLGRRERTEEERTAKCGAKLLGLAKTRAWDPLFSRGIPARPKVPPPPKARQWATKMESNAEVIAEGVVYTDGSAEGWHWKGARAAYGATCYTREGKCNGR